MSDPKKITFEEIQEGDLIEIVHIYASGLKLKREGIAADLLTSPSRMVWYHKGTHRQQILAESYGTTGPEEIWLLKREEKKDHIVVSTRVLCGTVEVQTLVGRTKTDAEELAAKWNRNEKTCGDRRIFRAVKV